MIHSTRQLLSLASAMTGVVAGVAGCLYQPVRAASSFCPAYFQPGNPSRLTLFPLEGPEAVVALPAGLPTNMRVITFSPDGRAIYGQKTEPLNPSTGIYKLEFQPARDSIVPGSVGMGEVQCLAMSQSLRNIIVAGWSWSDRSGGIFEIDPSVATRRRLSATAATPCGGDGGLMSPDYKRALVNSGNQLGLLDLKTGAIRTIKGMSREMRWTWSPDGQWIAGVRGGRIFLVAADDTSRARTLGSAGDGPVVWSPDSKCLLLRKSPLSCALTFYGESLEVLDVATGRRTLIGSSHCTITAGTLGWLDCRGTRGTDRIDPRENP